MDVSFGRVGQFVPPQFPEGAPGVPVAEKSAGGWETREVGTAELAKVAGEEMVDEAALRRDDDLGKLAMRAFDPGAALQALLRLFE